MLKNIFFSSTTPGEELEGHFPCHGEELAHSGKNMYTDWPTLPARKNSTFLLAGLLLAPHTKQI